METQTPNQNAPARSAFRRAVDKAAVVTGAVVVTAPAYAEFDVTAATGALGGVLVAVAAIGAVKIAPAAAAWAWSLLTRTASR